MSVSWPVIVIFSSLWWVLMMQIWPIKSFCLSLGQWHDWAAVWLGKNCLAVSQRGYDFPCTLPGVIKTSAHTHELCYSASVIIQSLSHNQLLGWQGQRCASRQKNAGIEQFTNKTECSLRKRHGYKPKLLTKTVNRINPQLKSRDVKCLTPVS